MFYYKIFCTPNSSNISFFWKRFSKIEYIFRNRKHFDFLENFTHELFLLSIALIDKVFLHKKLMSETIAKLQKWEHEGCLDKWFCNVLQNIFWKKRTSKLFSKKCILIKCIFLKSLLRKFVTHFIKEKHFALFWKFYTSIICLKFTFF